MEASSLQREVEKPARFRYPSRLIRRGPASQLQRSFECISELSKPKQKFVIQILETVLAQANS